MFLFIDPPVNEFSTVEAIRAWQNDLAAMRLRYHVDHEALACIARAEQHAERLLEHATWMGAPASSSAPPVNTQTRTARNSSARGRGAPAAAWEGYRHHIRRPAMATPVSRALV